MAFQAPCLPRCSPKLNACVPNLRLAAACGGERAGGTGWRGMGESRGMVFSCEVLEGSVMEGWFLKMFGCVRWCSSEVIGWSEMCSLGIGGVWVFGEGLVLSRQGGGCCGFESVDSSIVLVDCGHEISETALLSYVDGIEPRKMLSVGSLTLFPFTYTSVATSTSSIDPIHDLWQLVSNGASPYQ